jgi:PAS domain S-box-containing protein
VVTINSDAHLPIAGGVTSPRLTRDRARGRSVRLVALFASLAFLSLGFLTYSSVRLGEQAVRTHVEARVSEGSAAAAALVQAQMNDLTGLVESYAGHPFVASALGDGDPAHINQPWVTATLSALRASHQGIAVAFLADRTGHLIDILPATPTIVGQDFSYRDWFKGVTRTGKPYVSEAYQTAATGHARVVGAAAQIRGPSVGGSPGPVLGVLVAAYDLSAVQAFVDDFTTTDSIRLTVTDQRGVVVAAPGAGTGSGTTELKSERANPAVMAALAGRSGTTKIGAGDHRLLSAYAPVPGIGWTVRAEVPASIAYASASKLRRTVEAIAGVLGLVLLGGVLLLLATLRRRDRAEARRHDSEAFLDSVIEHIPDMVFVKDADDLRFVRLNRAAEDLLGHGRADLLGKSDFDLFPRDQAERFVAKDREVLSAAGVVDIAEEPIDTSSGERRILHTKKIPLFDADGRARYLLGISQDVTERHAANVAIAGAKEDAERANRAKSEFLSRMSHELRTPLNAILGFAQLLEIDDLEGDQEESVEQILRGGRHLLSLINEVLDISRIETGSLALSAEPVDVLEILDETMALIRSLANERRIRVEVDASMAGVRTVRADRQRLKQVLLNLASNAVKYNHENGTVRFSARPGAAGRLCIEVTDDGPGLTPEQLARLFVPFDRLGAEQTDVEGTGIGLALSRRLAEAMGGRLEATSAPDQGATFTVELPVAEAPPARFDDMPVLAPAVTTEATTGGVLYIEDNPTNLRLLERLLAQRGGIRLLTSTEGAPALALARRHRPDIVLLDLHLPDMDGTEVLRQLRADPVTAEVPVVIVSADATPGQIERLRTAGATDYMTKPFDLARLLELLDDVLAARQR